MTDSNEFLKTFNEKTAVSNNIIAEKLEIFQRYSTFLIPYAERKDLTTAEIVCIGNYQDIHFWNNQKQDWSFSLPKIWETKPWCYAVNSCCRNFEF